MRQKRIHLLDISTQGLYTACGRFNGLYRRVRTVRTWLGVPLAERCRACLRAERRRR